MLTLQKYPHFLCNPLQAHKIKKKNRFNHSLYFHL